MAIASISLHFNCDNDAFADNPGHEIGRILRLMARRAENDSLISCAIMDHNGNTVGEIVVKRNDDE